ncbi:MAG: putative sulfate exporter family transporter [Rothia sp. (in: high G+C Gram-positive bacteria)]|nr:putative sulfate exporter family transporter [Rothia sp. (in: high G+C Gram-positive bacteria)]
MSSPRVSRLSTYLPGLAVCAAAATVAFLLSRLIPGLSAMLVAIVLGVVVANTVRLPQPCSAGVTFAAKKLLRLGIVLLGLQVALGDIAALGAPMILVVIVTVVTGILGTIVIGRLLGVSSYLTYLVACGFSICGAAAVAGASGTLDPKNEHEEETVTAVALVVLFGTTMIGLVPLAAYLLQLDPIFAGTWAGGAIHEVAQVVAVGGMIGGGALTAAVLVKLARVLMLAPVIAVLGWVRRRELQDGAGATSLLPPVPLFVAGFMAMVLVRSCLPLPEAVLVAGSSAQTALLAAAMFALGCNVDVRKLLRVGFRPFILAALSTALVAGVSLAGVTLVL